MRPVVCTIDTRRLLSDEEVRQINAALALAGLDRKSFAAGTSVGYSVLSKTLAQQRTPSKTTAEALEGLLVSTDWPQPSAELGEALGRTVAAAPRGCKR